MDNVEELFGDEVRGLLRKYQNSIPVLKRGFAVPDSVPENSLLFIGINPSFNHKTEPHVPEELFYTHTQSAGHRYFSKFEELSKALHCPWSHLDLLIVRETKQSKVKEIIRNPKGLDFVVENLALSERILEQTKPLVIIVNNTLARTYLGKDRDGENNIWMGYEFEWDDEIGTYQIANADSSLKGIHVFFTSMLTGQRALDKGSYERLRWQLHRLGLKKGWIQAPKT